MRRMSNGNGVGPPRRLAALKNSNYIELIAKDRVDPVGPRKARILGAERAIKSTPEFRFIGSRATPQSTGVEATCTYIWQSQKTPERLYLGPPHLEASLPYSVCEFLACSELPNIDISASRPDSHQFRGTDSSTAFQDGASLPLPVAEPFAEAVVTPSPIKTNIWHRQPPVHDTPVKTLIPEKHGYIGRTHAVASAEVDIARRQCALRPQGDTILRCGRAKFQRRAPGFYLLWGSRLRVADSFENGSVRGTRGPTIDHRNQDLRPKEARAPTLPPSPPGGRRPSTTGYTLADGEKTLLNRLT
ncbi:hypothetical protein EDB84DRAFT_1677091, partial [Lactarius hengduanensis]